MHEALDAVMRGDHFSIYPYHIPFKKLPKLLSKAAMHTTAHSPRFRTKVSKAANKNWYADFILTKINLL